MNFRQWHLHILASTALLVTSLSFDAAAQTNGSNVQPVASLEKSKKIQHPQNQSTAKDFAAILQKDTWLDANTKTLLSEFLHIGAAEEFHNLFGSEKFNALDATAKRQVINAVSEFARGYHLEKAARMATSEAMTRILQGEVLSGKVFTGSNEISLEREVGSPTSAPVNQVNNVPQNAQTPVVVPSEKKPTTPVPSPYSALTQTPASRSIQTKPTTPVPSPYSALTTTPASRSIQTKPTTPVPSPYSALTTTPASGVGVYGPVTPPTTTTTFVSGGSVAGGSPSRTTTALMPFLPIEKSRALEEVIISNGVTDKPAQILKDVFDNTKTPGFFAKGGENYQFSQTYDALLKPENQARIAALTSDERKQFANAVEALITKATKDVSKKGELNKIKASSDKVFNVVDRLDRHEGLQDVIKTSLGKTVDQNALSGDVQTYLAQYKQDKLAAWRAASWTKIGTGDDANFWHWQEAYEDLAKDPNFTKLSPEMQVAVSGEVSAIAHREQANLKGDAKAAIKATDALHNMVTKNVRNEVVANAAVDHALPAATPHVNVTHDVAELGSIADSKAIVLKKVDKGFPDLASKAVGTVSTELLASVDEKGKVKPFYKGSVKLGANHEDPTYNDYYKWRSLQIAQQATTDPVGAEAALHALKNELAAQKTLHHNSIVGGVLAGGGITDKTEVNNYIAAVERKIESALNDPSHNQKILDTHALHEPVIQKSLAGVNAAHGAVSVQHTALGTAIGQAKEQVTKNSVVGDEGKNQAAQNAMTNLAAQHAEFVRLHNDANAHTAEIQAQKAGVIAEMRRHALEMKDHLAKDQHDALLAHIAQLEAAQADHAAIAQAHLAAFRGTLVHNQGQAEHHLIGGNRPPVTHTPPSL